MPAEARAPRVSVLVPCHDDARTLDPALASIAAQDFADLEVVIADDASSDGSAAIAEAWARRDLRFRALGNQRNLGMTANWNRALAAARGELVAKLDADDAFAPEFLATLVPELERAPAPIAAFCRTLDCDEELRPVAEWAGEAALRSAGLDPAREHRLPGLAWLRLCFDDRQLWHSNALLVRSADLRALGGWDERWSCAADTDLILRLLATGRSATHLPLAGVRYRRRAASVSARAAAEGWKAIESVLVGLEGIARLDRATVLATPPLRRNWWRLWRALDGLLDDRERWRRAPGGERGPLAEIAARQAPPPLPVRMEGRLRDAVAGARRRWRAA